MFFDDRLRTATQRHVRISGGYSAASSLASFLAAVAFVVGSVFFFFEHLQTAGTAFFLAGSVFFLFPPSLEVARVVHLRRLPDGGHQVDLTGS